MDKNLRVKYINLMTIMICSFVGVGFVSGAEIFEFFVRFGWWSFAAIIVFFLLCFVLTFNIIIKNSTDDNFYQKNAKILCKMSKNGQNYAIFTNFSKFRLRKFVVLINVLMISSAMFSGLKSLLLSLFFEQYILILILCFLFTFFLTYIGVRGLEKLDYFVLAFVGLICVFFIFDFSFDFKTISSLNKEGGLAFDKSWKNGIFSLFFAGLYVFMNILQFEPVVKNSGLEFSKRKAAGYSLIFAGSLSALLLVFVLFLLGHFSLGLEAMPFLKYFSDKGNVFSKIFAVGLLVCLLSTLVTCLIGVKNGVKNDIFTKKEISNFGATTISAGLAILLSMIPFNVFVSIIYPLLGAINFVTFLFL